MTLPKLVDDLVSRRIVEAVRAGASRTAAAEAARIGRSTLHLWLKKASTGEEPYASFAIRVREAEGELEKELLDVIKGHSVDSWQAAAWILERKFQKRWAIRRDRQDRDERPANGITAVTNEEHVSLLESMLAAARSAAG